MAATQTEQTRNAIYIDGVETFEIIITVTDAGDLPSKAVFVVQIQTQTDPKTDTFARVAAIADFTTYGTDRVAAIAAGDEYYRVTTFTFYYTDLNTGVAAADVLSSRIDELVTNWQTYDTSFVATAEIVEHPQPSLSAFEAAVAAYDTAVTAEATAKTTRDDAKTAYDLAVTDAATAAATVTATQTLYNNSLTVKGYFDACLTGLTNLYTKSNAFSGTGTAAGAFLTNSKTYRTAAETLRGACTADPPTSAQKSAYDSAVATYNSQVGAFETDIATYRQDVTVSLAAKNTGDSNQALFAAYCSGLQTAYTTAQTAKATADTAVATTLTTYKEAQAAYVVAQANTEAALAAVRSMDPTWTPTT
jgi:hypothetical protein